MSNPSGETRKPNPAGRALFAGLIAGVAAGSISYLLAGFLGLIVGFIAGVIVGSRTVLLVEKAKAEAQ